MKYNKVYNENCIETLKRLKDNSINCVITSPPYNMNLRIRNGEYCSRQITNEFSTKYNNFSDNMPIEDFYNLHLKILKELLRVSNIIFYNIQIVTGSKRAFFKIIGELSESLKDIIIWDKINVQPSMGNNILNKRTEMILVFDNKNAISRQFKIANFQRGTLNDIWQIKKNKSINNKHKATFPEELINKIIINFTNKNSLIYDPFMGTGTTALCCLKNNRNFLGSEISKEYCSIINKRIDVYKNQLKLF
jgi:site-specific DNA-methyltransferase (adenine-specific)